MSRAAIDEVKRMQGEIDSLVRALNNAKACFTCGSLGVDTVELDKGCACFPHVRGTVWVCMQHAYKVQPL